VAERRDTSRSVDVDPDITLVGERRRPGVDADPDADRTVGQSVGDAGRRRQGVGRGRERDEERVALGVDLVAAVGRDRVPDDPPMFGQSGRIGIGAELLDEAGRPLDVGEQERDRPARQYSRHGPYFRRERQAGGTLYVSSPGPIAIRSTGLTSTSEGSPSCSRSSPSRAFASDSMSAARPRTPSCRPACE
jgi:hypothetical protein